MVSLSLVRSANGALVTSQPIVAVFVGVAGIVGYAAQALATAHGSSGKGLRAYILGRTLERVQPLIDSLQKACPTGQFIFVQANDLTLLRDVDIVCADILELEKQEAKAQGVTPKIDILIMGQAIFDPFSGLRKETKEGLDTFMSLLHYSRMRFTTQLLPLLLASPLPAHVISVFGPGRDDSFIPSDLSLRAPENYGFMSSGSHAAYFKTFFMEHLAEQHAGKLSLVHYFPGLVLTPAFDTTPWWFRSLFRYGHWILRWFMVQPKECGERVLFCASEKFPARNTAAEKGYVAASSDGIVGGGAYRVNWNGEEVKLGKKYPELRKEGWREKCVEHTLKAFEEIEAGRKFTD